MLKYSEFKLYLTDTFSPEILSLNEEIPALYWYPNLNCNDLNDIPRIGEAINALSVLSIQKTPPVFTAKNGLHVALLK